MTLCYVLFAHENYNKSITDIMLVFRLSQNCMFAYVRQVRLALYRGILLSYQVQFSRPWTSVHTPIICYGYNLYSVSLFIVLNMRVTLPYIHLNVWCLLCI